MLLYRITNSRRSSAYPNGTGRRSGTHSGDSGAAGLLAGEIDVPLTRAPPTQAWLGSKHAIFLCDAPSTLYGDTGKRSGNITVMNKTPFPSDVPLF